MKKTRNQSMKIKVPPTTSLERAASLLKGILRLQVATVGELQSALLGAVLLFIDTTMETQDEGHKRALAMEIIARALDDNAGSPGVAALIDPLENMEPASGAVN